MCPWMTPVIVRERQLRLYGHVAGLPAEDPPIGFFFVEIRVAGPCRGASTRFMVGSGGDLSEGCEHGGPGVCLSMARRRPSALT